MRFLRQSLVGVFLASLTLALLFVAIQIVTGAVQEVLIRENEQPKARERVFAVTVRPAVFETVTPNLEETRSRAATECPGEILEAGPLRPAAIRPLAAVATLERRSAQTLTIHVIRLSSPRI